MTGQNPIVMPTLSLSTNLLSLQFPTLPAPPPCQWDMSRVSGPARIPGLGDMGMGNTGPSLRRFYYGGSRSGSGVRPVEGLAFEGRTVKQVDVAGSSPAGLGRSGAGGCATAHTEGPAPLCPVLLTWGEDAPSLLLPQGLRVFSP